MKDDNTLTLLSNIYISLFVCKIVLSQDDNDGLTPVAILSSHPNENLCKKLSSHYVLPDTNVILEEIDLLEDVNGVQNVIILQTVLKEVRHRSTAIYKRLKDIISYNKRRFYVFLNEHHKGNCIYYSQKSSPNLRRIFVWGGGGRQKILAAKI